MRQALSPEIRSWLQSLQWGQASVDPVPGGTNNIAFRLNLRDEFRFLKIHAKEPGDARDRFEAENEFYDQLHGKSFPGAPIRHSTNPELRAILLEWVHGKKVALPVHEDSVRQALEFLLSIQREAGRLGFPAREACFSLAEHRSLLARRITCLSDQGVRSMRLRTFLDQELLPFWKRTEAALGKSDNSDFSLSGGRRLLSPGDFGFHNALVRPSGQITFFDFEYSGWDDPAKTAADIFLQPESPVDWKHWDFFIETLGKKAEMGSSFPVRARALLPVFAAKWACILLGSLHKRGATPDEKLVGKAIGKAKAILERVAHHSE